MAKITIHSDFGDVVGVFEIGSWAGEWDERRCASAMYSTSRKISQEATDKELKELNDGKAHRQTRAS